MRSPSFILEDVTSVRVSDGYYGRTSGYYFREIRITYSDGQEISISLLGVKGRQELPVAMVEGEYAE